MKHQIPSTSRQRNFKLQAPKPGRKDAAHFLAWGVHAPSRAAVDALVNRTRARPRARIERAVARVRYPEPCVQETKMLSGHARLKFGSWGYSGDWMLVLGAFHL